MSENAEENDTNQSKFYRVLSSEPVTDTIILFDTIEKFLTKDKKRQLSSEYLDEKDQIASRLTWVSLLHCVGGHTHSGFCASFLLAFRG